jgi:hypothetical protein
MKNKKLEISLPSIKIPARLKSLENRIGVEGIKSVVRFAASTFRAVKQTLADGEVGLLDIGYFIDPITNVSDMIKNIASIPDELLDEITNEELHEVLQILLSYGVVPEDLIQAFEDHLLWARHTKQLIFRYYIKD